MTVIEHKNVKYNIPTNWDEITTDKYIKLINMVNMFKDVDGNLTIDDEALFPRVVEILSGIKRTDVYDIEFKSFVKLRNDLNFLSLEPKYAITKKEYFTVDNYIIKIKDFDRLSFGEYINTMHLKEVSPDNIIKSIANMVDVYERRNILKFKLKNRKLDLTIDEKEKFISVIPATEFLNLSFFLTNGQLKSLRTLRHSLEVMALRQNMNNVFRAIGVIIYGLWHSLVKTQRRLEKL